MNIQTLSALVFTFAVWLCSPVQVKAKDVQFRAKIDEIKITRKFDKTTIVTGVNPRFVVRLTLEQDAEGIGKRGEAVSFAIHSPSRDLRIKDQRAAVGTQMLLRLSHSKESGLEYLRRVETNKAQQVAPSDGDKASD